MRGLGTLSVAAAWLALAPGAQAQQLLHGYQCAADRFKVLQQPSFSGSLNCTANDVAITQIAINRNYYPGVNTTAPANLLSGAGCVGGTSAVANLNVTVQFNSPARYDIGIFLAEDGGNPQLLATSAGGAQQCTVSILPLDSGGIPNPFGTGTVPSPFNNLNNATGGYCGDGSSTTVPTAAYAAATGRPTGTGSATFIIYDVPIRCSASTGSTSGKLNIPFVVSWMQNAGNSCSGPTQVSPGTTSKCNAPTGTLGDVDVVALPQVAKSNSVSTLSPGDATTYAITVSNQTGSAIPASTLADPAVAGLSVGAVTCAAAGGATCPAGLSPATLAAGLALGNMPHGSTLTFNVSGTITSSGLGTPASPWVPADGASLTNTATVTVQGVTISAVDTDTVHYPKLTNAKTVVTVSDPVRGPGGSAGCSTAPCLPLNIPGAIAQYSITLSNSGRGRVDQNTVVVTDPIPANTSLYVGLPSGATSCTGAGVPVGFADGSNSSGLTFTAGTDLQYSSDNGGTWTASPAWAFVPAVATANGTLPPGCYAANVTNIRVNPKGRMAAAATPTSPTSFTLGFQVLVR
ncbi:hypothetical protein ASG30_00345 [Ramlibacter sp. Leaf400]|nr:hypothetical protein ASG30_00345 [Ramlibacter sp. Leaf400]